MTFDWDDFHESNHKLWRLWELKALNPLFRCTVFAVPGLGSDTFWACVPRWIELAVHGWTHPSSRECEQWARETIEDVLDSEVVRKHFVNGWKSPGWLTSPDIYEVLLERDWWIADQHLADDLRPPGLRVYLHEDGDNWHGHIQDWGSNGIDETWAELREKVRDAREFRFASESARQRSHSDDPRQGSVPGGVPPLRPLPDVHERRAPRATGRAQAGLLEDDEPARREGARGMAPPARR